MTTTLPRSMWALLALGALTVAACSEQAVEPNSSHIDGDQLSAKGGKPGKPGGGGGGSGGPAEITILFDHHQRRGPGFSIYGMDRTGADTRLLSDADESDMESLTPRWAPDGVHFVYSREVVGQGRYDIVVGKVDGTIVPILSAPALRYPAWSPLPLADGQERIAFVQQGDLYVMRTDGSDVDRLTTGRDVEGLVWSRDATQILASVQNVTYNAEHLELFVVSCGVSACQVTGSTALDLSAFGISPDDRLGVSDWAHGSDRVLIHYVQADFYGLRELGILDLTGAPSFSFLTNNPGGQAYNGAWSWNDTEVVYVKFPIGKKGKAGIVIRNVATGVETQISNKSADFGMDWRPTPPSGQ